MNKSHSTASALAVIITLASSATHAQIDERLWGLSMVGAGEAWEKGFRGTGVRVGIMDDGIQFDHPEFAARWMGGFNVDGTPYGPYGADHHGTHVAGTVGGQMVGVAPASQIYGINWAVPGVNDDGFAAGYRWAMSQGVRVINNSWGKSFIDPVTGLPIRSITVGDVTREEVAHYYAPLVQALRETVNADIVQVFATGNSAMPEPGVIAGLPYFFPELQPNWIAVTSVGPTGNISSYAERCGVAAAWCISAPGGDGANGTDQAIWSSWPGSGYYSINGTSMATPHVTGAVALAAEMFPNASGVELTQLVLHTATDIGAPGIDPVYGWGLLNIGNMVDTANPSTAGVFANAAWSRSSTLAHVSNIMQQRLALPGAPAAMGGISFEALGYASSVSIDTQSSDVMKPRVWAAPIFATSSIAAGTTSFGANSTVGGMLIGADMLRDDSSQFGLALGYSQTRLQAATSDDKGTTNAFHLGAYGALTHGDWFVEGTGQAAYFDQSLERRSISGAVGGSVSAVGRSTLSGGGLDLSLQVGRKFQVMDSYAVAPYLAVGAQWQATKTGNESGAGIFGLTIPAASYSHIAAGPGIRVESAPIQIESSTLRIATDVSYARVGGNTDNATSVSLVGRAIEGRSAAIGRDILRVGGQLDFSTNAKRHWFSSYNGSFQKRATSHTMAVGFKINF